MNKFTLLKIIILVIALAAVLAVVFAAMNSRAPASDTNSKTFFAQFIVDGGPIVWFIMLPLSVITLHFSIDYCVTIRRKTLLPAGFSIDIIKTVRQNGCKDLATWLSEKNDFVSRSVMRAISNLTDDRRQTQIQLQMQNVIAESIQEQSLKLMRKIEWTNIIGNVAPMIGLFGTVFGMIKLFNEIVLAGGQPRPDQMAGGISIALVTTFWGLLIAIPALAVHGVFRNRIETLAAEAALQAEMVLVEIKTSMDTET
ncbi:MAG: hypothetical protein GWO86_01400 [Planctomycetes bacterium]|nr:hypothetical protein [Planctomycetota bacterium]